jgi:hypothetical protein
MAHRSLLAAALLAARRMLDNPRSAGISSMLPVERRLEHSAGRVATAPSGFCISSAAGYVLYLKASPANLFAAPTK